MANALPNVYGSLLVVRPPVPATVNKAGANYKSEVAHEHYSPRRAYDEWLSICEAITASGGDALFEYESADNVFLDRGDLEVDGDGNLRPAGSTDVIANLAEVDTGRVFTANGPWVVVEGSRMRALMPNMLAHRKSEQPYYRDMLGRLADAAGLELDIRDNPHRWEGMADVATVGDKVVLTYTVRGHYDEGVGEKSMRSSLEGVTEAADFADVPAEARIFAELVYPHFHGDTVHYGGRPTNRAPVLVHYTGGLYGDGASRVADALGADTIVAIGRDDAVEQYAGNSRQVANGVLVPDGVSPAYLQSIEALGLTTHRVPLFELFGKAGGGPACATLYLPSNLELPANAPMRYSVRREEARARRERIPDKLTVAPEFFQGRARG